MTTNNTLTRILATTTASLALLTGATIITSAPAHASTAAPPISWQCKYLGICKTTTVCVGDTPFQMPAPINDMINRCMDWRY